MIFLDSRSYNTLYNWRFESSKTKVPRRKIYDFCLRRDEEKINVLESDWSHPEVVSKWYAVGIMPADEDSDQDDDQVRKKPKEGQFCVCVRVHYNPQIMSSSSILKSPGGVLG